MTVVPTISRKSGSFNVELSVLPTTLIPTAMGIRTNDFIENCAAIPVKNDLAVILCAAFSSCLVSLANNQLSLPSGR